MKLTWKKNKKRPLMAVSQFSNLPFENQQDDDVPQHQKEAKKDADNDEDSIVKNQNPNQSQTQAGRELSEARQLSKEFQAQGDKLAEVLIIHLLLSVQYLYFRSFGAAW